MKRLSNLSTLINLVNRLNLQTCLLIGALILICCFSHQVVNAAPISNNLYAEAESFIANTPVESSQSVYNIINSYALLQNKWLGEKNALANKRIVSTNPIFAQGAISNLDLESNSPLLLHSNIKFRRLHYQTPNIDGIQHVSGLLLIPPTNKPKGIILFFHSTISGKLNVPSLHFDDYKAQILAAVFASNGYIVVCPDYIGLGDNLAAVHPYVLYPQVNVEDGKNILNAAIKYLHKTAPGTIIPSNLFVSGYSEGGGYALWFSRIYQENIKFAHQINSLNLKLIKTVPIEGAYDLTNVMFPFLLANQVNDTANKFNINTALWGTMLKPSLVAHIMLSYAHYNRQDIKRLLNVDFFSLNCTLLPDKICGQDEFKQYNLDNFTLTSSKNLTMALKYFLAANFKATNGLVYSPFFNGVEPLLAVGAKSNVGLLHAAALANILDWKSTNPITLISLTHDSLVPEQNSTDAQRGMLKAGSLKLKYIKVDNNLLKSHTLIGNSVIDHVNFELYALLIALNEFNHI
ncbi:MAG: hypothetical protein KBD37_00740 [Burkholderiales bacterium]|nr:hypothetical protein [Burkholderiales bacterium]